MEPSQIKDLELFVDPVNSKGRKALAAAIKKLKEIYSIPLEGDKCDIVKCWGLYKRQVWTFGPYMKCDNCGHTIYLKQNGERI